MHPIAAAMNRALTILGSLSANAASTTVASSTRTIKGSGTLLFNNLAGGGIPYYSKNGGSFTLLTEALTLAVVAGDTLQVQVTGLSPGTRTFDIRNNAGLQPLIQSVTLRNTL